MPNVIIQTDIYRALPGVTDMEKAVLLALAHCCYSASILSCCPSLDDLSRLTSISLTNIRVSLESLERKSYIFVEKRDRSTDIYTLNVSKLSKEAASREIVDTSKWVVPPYRGLCPPKDLASFSFMEKLAKEVLDYFNRVCSRSFPLNNEVLEPIIARLKEGANPYVMCRVTDEKARQWIGRDRMVNAIRPLTFFGVNYFLYATEISLSVTAEMDLRYKTYREHPPEHGHPEFYNAKEKQEMLDDY